MADFEDSFKDAFGLEDGSEETGQEDNTGAEEEGKGENEGEGNKGTGEEGKGEEDRSKEGKGEEGKSESEGEGKGSGEDGEGQGEGENQSGKEGNKDKESDDDSRVLPSDDDDKKTTGGDFEKSLLEKSGGKFKSYADIEKALEEAPQNAFANETVEKLNDYVKKGGDPQTFLRTQTVDYSQLSDVAKIREWMSVNKPNLSSEEIDFIIEEEYGVPKDATERQKRASSIRMKDAAYDAEKNLKDYQSKWSVPQSGGKSQEEIDNETREWESSLENTVEKFDKMEIKVGDDKFNYDLSKEDKKSLVDSNKDLRNFFNRYKKEDGSENVQKFVRDAYILNNFDNIIKAVAKFAEGKGEGKTIEDIKNPDFKGKDNKGQSEGKSLGEQLGENMFG